MEQQLDLSLRLADRVMVLGRGQVVFSGTAQQLQAQEALRRQWLEI
jgi:branched-chain amino acid transport system ATP-binding protein